MRQTLGEQERAEIGAALHVPLVEHIDDTFHHHATRLIWRARQDKANRVGQLRFAVIANFLSHQL